jgi:hypothetical protein
MSNAFSIRDVPSIDVLREKFDRMLVHKFDAEDDSIRFAVVTKDHADLVES